MTFALTIVAVCAAGLGVLRLLRLTTGSWPADVALAWFVGSGWLGLAAFVLRFLAGVPFATPTLVLLALAPGLASFAFRAWRRRRGTQEHAGAGGAAARWLPRPTWVYAPIATYVALVVVVVLLHGANTPTQTDDGVRVRAFTPMLAAEDAWPPESRGLLVLAGPVPTFVPAVAWTLTGTIDHFHVNYVVLADLVALLVLAIGLGVAGGSPERGWAMAFGVLSIPFFVYHCTSTYQDAVLAIFVGAALIFALEHARTGDRRDALRALVLLLAAALVKREGEIVAASAGVVVAARLLWERRRADVLAVAVVAAAAALFLAAKVAAVGLDAAFPLVSLLASRAEGAFTAGAPSTQPPGTPGLLWAFGYALLRSGNTGMIYWLLPAAVLLRPRAALRARFAWPLAFVAVLFLEAAASAVWLLPQFTLDQTTVHRSLLVVSVPAALWLAAFLVDDAYGLPPPAAGGAD